MPFQAATFSFSGFSITDSFNSNNYEAEGSFDLRDGFSGGFDIYDTSNLSVTVTTISGLATDFTFNSSHIDFDSSTFEGSVIRNTATFKTISLTAIANGSPVLLGDTLGLLNYNNFALGLVMDSRFPNVSGTGFNDATTNNVEPIPEPVTILGSLLALGIGSVFRSNQLSNKSES